MVARLPQGWMVLWAVLNILSIMWGARPYCTCAKTRVWAVKAGETNERQKKRSVLDPIPWLLYKKKISIIHENLHYWPPCARIWAVCQGHQQTMPAAPNIQLSEECTLQKGTLNSWQSLNPGCTRAPKANIPVLYRQTLTSPTQPLNILPHQLYFHARVINWQKSDLRRKTLWYEGSALSLLSTLLVWGPRLLPVLPKEREQNTHK